MQTFIKNKLILRVLAAVVLALLFVTSFGAWAQEPEEQPPLAQGVEEVEYIYLEGGGDWVPRQLSTFRNGPLKYRNVSDNIVRQLAECEVMEMVQKDYTGRIDVPWSVSVFTDNFHVVDIGGGAFQWCALSEVQLPNSIRTVKNYAFADCYNLREVEFKGPTRFLDDYAFARTQSLKHISLPPQMHRIGTGAFMGSAIEDIVIPSHLQEMGEGVFDSCFQLAKVKFDGDGPEILPVNTFLMCGSLQSVDLPVNVSEIGEQAFCSSGIERVSWGSRMRIIHPNAFRDCLALTLIESSAVVPPVVEDHEFDQIAGQLHVVVPAGSKEAYLRAQGWRQLPPSAITER